MKAEKNPFRSSAIAKVRYRMDAAERSRLITRLQQHEWLGSIVGPEGSGKTTLMEDLESTVCDAGRQVVWIHLNRESTAEERRIAVRQILQLGAAQCCFLDGGEVLGRLNWWKLSRCSKHLQGGLLATLHKPRFLPVTFATTTDAETCIALAQLLAGQMWDEEIAHVAREAFAEQNGNAREVFRTCYHYYASRVSSQHPAVDRAKTKMK